ncbi:MAG: DUF1573 domain-containing protein [Planctomycetota bacterium]|nr:DUF1573 domain-containing protein [Planctomycetota bacterium]
MSMHRHIIGKSLLFLTAIVGVAWLAWTTMLESSLSGDLSHDFGVVLIDRPSSVLEHTFRLTNEKDETLNLIKATPSCGCTTTEWPEEPVLSGEELIIQTHLTLQRSQLRSSKIRLDFDNGEMVVLHIKGVGRFKQPLSFVQQAMKLSLDDKDGFRGVLKLEWYEKAKPPRPTFEIPDGLRVEFDQWRLATSADQNKMTPQVWTIVLKAYQIAELKKDASLLVKIEGVTQLAIPCSAETMNPPPPKIG